ncbi:MAG: 3-oxoacyl-[acyl-carrier-protein] reductase [Ktedonobacteraceae bacterium]
MFKGKTVVVTGAGRGIGRTLALGFAEQGATVLVHYLHSLQGAEDVARQIELRGGHAVLMQADLSQSDQVAQFITEAHMKLGPFDVWINNAGASANSKETQGMTEVAVCERIMAVDVMGAWQCCRKVEPLMNDGGCILTIGWDGALAGAIGLTNQLYAMSKGAIMSLTRCLALEFAPRVRVNCIAPGWIKNDWSHHLSENTHQKMIQSVPMKRWGTAEDILGTALFLASPAASYITGQIIPVNGGQVMR